MIKRNLTVKQQRFIEAFNGNATEAAIMAGYSKKSAKEIGYENLTKHHIVEEIFKREEKKLDELIATRKERQGFWTEMMQNEGIPAMVRLRASELLGKSEGDFIERRQLENHPIEMPKIIIRLKEPTNAN
tara:strand:+ start:570 stop:959 length:390 start_codon:yes stop_codon:yes gene_type:complete